MKAVAISLSALGDTEPLWRDWLDDAKRRFRSSVCRANSDRASAVINSDLAFPSSELCRVAKPSPTSTACPGAACSARIRLGTGAPT